MTLPPPTIQDQMAVNQLPEMRWHNGAGEWQVIPPWAADTRYGRVEGPAGFMSDGMSDPIGRSWGRQGWAAVVHDLLYRLQPDGWTRGMADTVFRDLMIEFGVRPWRAWARYGVLCLCGWRAWRKNKRNVLKLREIYYGKTKRYGGNPAST